tara:strand:+ start:824 stop:1963 length:1140 start_codon:yes stop_codon:yes gene_type:complete
MKTYKNLSNLASSPNNSKGRLIKEEYSLTRSEFQRDRDRIIHSAAFRRLKHKTQVFVTHEGDHYRTRLTHSLEVSQIARSICRIFNLNEDLAETLALAHDIGHPPFGHAGEAALSNSMDGHGGFDHNDQAIRVVHILEKKYFEFDGLNLTWETLEGLVKHNGPVKDNIPQTISDLNYQFNLSLDEYASLEAQIAAIADDIAYNNHDVDDGLRAGFFTYQELKDLPLIGNIVREFPKNFENRDIQRINNEITRRSTAQMVNDVLLSIASNVENYGIENIEDVRKHDSAIASFTLKMQTDVDTIREFLSDRMYNHEKVRNMSKNAGRTISALYDLLIEDKDLIYSKLKIKKDDKISKPRRVCDFIAGMTDNYAQSIYQEYC